MGHPSLEVIEEAPGLKYVYDHRPSFLSCPAKLITKFSFVLAREYLLILICGDRIQDVAITLAARVCETHTVTSVKPNPVYASSSSLLLFCLVFLDASKLAFSLTFPCNFLAFSITNHLHSSRSPPNWR